jgi:hypothetical protein
MSAWRVRSWPRGIPNLGVSYPGRWWHRAPGGPFHSIPVQYRTPRTPWDLAESRIGDGVRSEYRIIDWSSSPGTGTHLVNTMPWNGDVDGLTAGYGLGCR